MKNLYNPLFILILSLLVLCSYSSKAQDKTVKDTIGKDKDSKAKEYRIKNLAQALSITEGKAIEVYSAMNYNQDAIKQLMQDSLIKPSERQIKFKKLVEEQRKKIQMVLSPEQIANLREFQKQKLGDKGQNRARFEQQNESISRQPIKGGKLKSQSDSLIRKN